MCGQHIPLRFPHHVIWAAAQEFITALKPVVKISQQRFQELVEKDARFGLIRRIHARNL
jgi:2-oxo-4-hydroxy-4-carboxy--5-ureidoimidazoline (OHCU) decarboxylase